MELCDLLAAKCGKIASIQRAGSAQDLTRLLEEIPTDSETFELVARFCQGYDLNMSPENVVALSCLADFLDMSEAHCPNNLLRKALLFFERKVLPTWNDTVRAFRATDSVLHQAARIGIFGACIDSLVSKAVSDPRLLGDPGSLDRSGGDDDEDFSPPRIRRRLFALGWKSEDLTTLPLRLYDPLVSEMVRRGVPAGHVAVSLRDYARKWALGFDEGGGASSGDQYGRSSRRAIIEAVERLLPDETGPADIGFLFEMLRCANALEASLECRDLLEFRIGKGLHEAAATVDDFLILSRGRPKEERYDLGCFRRILQHFYGNYTSSSVSGLLRVAELVEEFLAEIASDVDLDRKAFAELAEISVGVSKGTQRSSDGIYKGIDVYLDSHRHLTESEREEVCRPLDLQRMSPEACDHAAKNERLPMRVVLQVLFAAQLQLRDTIVARSSRDHEEEPEEEEEDGEEVRLLGDEESAAEMKVMSKKIGELERECVAMKREIRGGDKIGGGGERRVVKKEKVSLWKEMKRKFGCVSSTVTDCNCQLKKKRRT